MATKKSTSSGTSRGTSSSGVRPTARKRSDSDDVTSKNASAPRAAAPKRASASQIASKAARQLLELIGKDPEGVTGLERSDDGWTVQVDVVELRRVPSTTDVLGTYQVEVDSHGELQGYRRVGRYVRGDSGGE